MAVFMRDFSGRNNYRDAVSLKCGTGEGPHARVGQKIRMVLFAPFVFRGSMRAWIKIENSTSLSIFLKGPHARVGQNKSDNGVFFEIFKGLHARVGQKVYSRHCCRE